MKLVPNDVHVNGEPVKLVVPGDNPDAPDTVYLWDGGEGCQLVNPGDVMEWVKATCYLFQRALNRLAAVKEEHGRDDLRHVISWAIPAGGDQLHIRLQVRLP